MKVITINNLNDGIDVKNDPSAISEGGVVDCIGFDLSEEGVLKTSKWLSDHNLGTVVPSGELEWFQRAAIADKTYWLFTTSDGLYSNGALIDANFTGRFKALSFAGNIYLINGTYAKRFDGNNIFQWGISPPTTVPTISRGTYLYKDIDTFEAVTEWAANQVDCTVTLENAIIKEGSGSGQFNVVASTTGYSFLTDTLDLTVFSSGDSSVDDDYIRMWLYVDVLSNLDYISLFFDTGNGLFDTDYFSYDIATPGVSGSFQTLGFGKTAETISEETITTIESTPPPVLIVNQGDGTYYDANTLQPYIQPTSLGTTKETTIITKNITKTVVDPVLEDQILSFWRRSRLFKLDSAVWTEIKIPKKMFVQNGDASKDWSDVVAVKFEIKTNANGAVNVYIDGLKLVGGSDLEGDYWFTYCYGRTDADGNIVHESPPARYNKQVVISGPINFDRHPLSYPARQLSSDDQVNCGVIYGIGGSLTDFWDIATISNNTTSASTVTDVGDKFSKRKLVSKHNEVAPIGTDMGLWLNKIWMVGFADYPMLVRSSDILIDGRLSPEGWPLRNAYEVTGNHGRLSRIDILNEQLVVKGKYGEWRLQVNDPTDFLQVSGRQISDKGILADDGVVVLPTSHIYPSNRGFVETDGRQSSFVLPQIEPLIDTNISGAKAASSGLVSYFSYTTDAYGDRTAKVDLYRGKARFSNINNYKFDCLQYDPINDVLYGIYSKALYRVDYAYENVAEPSGEMYAFIKSKVFRPGGRVGWNRVCFNHNTNGIWFRLDVYVDDKLMDSMPFYSENRTEGDFRFGPWSGYDFQFVITGDTTGLSTIHYPIRIYHSG